MRRGYPYNAYCCGKLDFNILYDMIGKMVTVKSRTITTALFIALVMTMATACSGKSVTTSENESLTTADSLRQDSKDNEIVDVYGGPGEDYAKIASIPHDKIEKYIKYENKWIEVDYGKKRGYIRENESGSVDVNTIPHVVYSISSNIYPYPTVYNVRADISLFDEARVYSSPGSSDLMINIPEGEHVTILCSERSSFFEYIQIEFSSDEGKRRGYSYSVDLLSFDNPLLNFNEVKEKNTSISYGGNEYYSASGDDIDIVNGWQKQDEKVLSRTDVDWLAGIAGIVAGNDLNDEAIEATQGKIQLYDSKDRQYKNANVSKEDTIAKASIVDFLLGSAISFMEKGVNKTTLNVRMDKCGNENRMVIRTGSPIEKEMAGREITLSALMAERSNTALTEIQFRKEADAMIKAMYPNLDNSKTYSMKMIFSKEFENNNYGYYIVIDKNIEVYAIPIIHSGTSFKIFSEDGFVRDATWDLATAMIKMDEDSKSKIIELLEEGGFIINSSNGEEKTTDFASLVKDKAGSDVVWSDTADYDGDGSKETFAITGEWYGTSSTGSEAWSKPKIWFVSSTGEVSEVYQVKVFGYVNGVFDDPNDSGYRLLSIESTAGGSGSGSTVFGVRDGKAVEAKSSGRNLQMVRERIMAAHDEYVKSGGHKLNWYELTFDPESFELTEGESIGVTELFETPK